MSASFCSTRFSIAYGIFIVTLADHYKRYSFALTVVAMTKNENEHLAINNNATNYTELPYTWDNRMKANAVAAFFYGYTVSALLCGQLIAKIGARYGIGLSELFSAILQFLFPLAAQLSYEAFIAVRVLDGLLSGFLYVGTCALFGIWGLPHELGKMSMISMSANWLGISIGFSLTGFISSTLGWNYSFYSSGIFMIFALAIWFAVSYDSPHTHPRISTEEKEFIMTFRPSDKVDALIEMKSKKVAPSLPWRRIVTNKPVIGLALFHASYNWAFYYIVTTFSQYLNDVHKTSVTTNGVLNCLPYLLGLVGTILSGHLMDTLVLKKFVAITSARKSFVAFYSVFVSICFVCVGIFGENLSLTIVMLCIGGFMLGVGIIPLVTNPMDLSPSFAGEVGSLCNTVACLPGFVAPIINGEFLRHHSGQKEWMYSFLLVGGNVVAACVFYLYVGSGKVQTFDTKFYKARGRAPEKI